MGNKAFGKNLHSHPCHTIKTPISGNKFKCLSGLNHLKQGKVSFKY